MYSELMLGDLMAGDFIAICVWIGVLIGFACFIICMIEDHKTKKFLNNDDEDITI